MKKLVLNTLVIMAAGSAAHAKIASSLETNSGRLSQNIQTSGTTTILIDENTGEACVVAKSGINSQGLNICNEQEMQEAARIAEMPRNPQFASLVGVALNYYTFCSAIQFSPDIFDALVDSNDERTIYEKVKDAVNPSQDRKALNDFRSGLQKFSETVTGTICLPVGAANKKLLEIYHSSK